jgi:iron-sulfur cluster repair protein YtfE (RIC family)
VGNPEDRYAVEYAGDVVELLTDQHERLKALMGRVVAARGEERQALFDEVRATLAHHEAAEEAVVRPLTRRAPGGEEQAATRTGEEDRAKDALALMEELDVDSPGFEVQYQELQEAVLRHAEMEETLEFPLLRRSHDPATLREARTAVERVEAGERPHTGTFSSLLEHARGLFSRS